MAIYDILNGFKDTRDGKGVCSFNGFVEDYISKVEDDEASKEIVSFLKLLFEKDTNLKIAVDLQLRINKDAIANQIIRYKDSFKLPQGTIQCPYVVYGKQDQTQKAMVLTVGEKEDYVVAKALYYVMSEPENEYDGTRNEIIAANIHETTQSLVLDSVDRFFFQNEKAGIIQRNLDAKLFLNYDEMYEVAQKIASYQLVNLKEILAQSTNQEAMINRIIAMWYLMKKFSYVQYMMDKNTLNRIHGGNVKKQRQVAKEKCDAIGFVSYSELWKLVKKLKRI